MIKSIKATVTRILSQRGISKMFSIPSCWDCAYRAVLTMAAENIKVMRILLNRVIARLFIQRLNLDTELGL